MVNTQQKQICWKQELDDYVRKVHLAANGNIIIAATSNGTVYGFNNEEGTELICRQLHTGGVISSDVSADQTLMATGGEDGSFLLTNIANNAIVYCYQKKGAWIEHVAFNKDGYVAFACEKTVFIIDSKGNEYGRLVHPERNISALYWHIDGNTLAVGAYGGVQLYSLPQKKVYASLPWKNSILSLTISRDKRYVCSGTQDSQVHIWPLPYNPENDLGMTGFPNKVKHLSWHYKQPILATNCAVDVLLWDFGGKGPSGKTPDILKGHTANVTSLAFQRNGNYLVSGDESGLVCIWSLMEGLRPIDKIKLRGEITSLLWINDEKIAAGTGEGTLNLIA